MPSRRVAQIASTTAFTKIPTPLFAVLDATERPIPRGTKGILGQMGDKIVVLDRVEATSKRFVVKDAEGKTYARAAHTVKILRAHGRFVKAAKINDYLK